MADAFNLQRFINAQDPVYAEVRQELRDGRKETHWMWFVFPQIQGLGRSAMAIHYAISSPAEAEAYLNHPILGRRLLECTQLVNAVSHRTIEQIFGSVDAMKFRSSMTLFCEVASEPAFRQAIDKYFAGQPDPQTLAHL